MTKKKPPLVRQLHGLLFKLPLMISCREFEDFIVDYLDDELTPKQKFTFELHLKICKECRAYLKAYRMTMELAKSAIDEDTKAQLENVPEDLIAAILAARKK